jgi:hypothetical protein
MHILLVRKQKPKKMSAKEARYYAGEFSDAELDALADTGVRLNYRRLQDRYAQYRAMKIHRQQTNSWPIETACDALQDRVSELESAARIGDEFVAD